MKTERIVKFTKQIYSYEVVAQAAKDYSGICAVIVSETPEDILCRFVFPREANHIIINEFANYLIELECTSR